MNVETQFLHQRIRDLEAELEDIRALLRQASKSNVVLKVGLKGIDDLKPRSSGGWAGPF